MGLATSAVCAPSENKTYNSSVIIGFLGDSSLSEDQIRGGVSHMIRVFVAYSDTPVKRLSSGSGNARDSGTAFSTGRLWWSALHSPNLVYSSLVLVAHIN